MCFYRCSYCNFRTDIGTSTWLTLADAREKLKLLKMQGIIEILILSGEVHPDSPARKSWFQRIYDLCDLALSMGFLPHTNAGVLSFSEMAQLKQVNVSMGLMLEQLTPKLLQTVHLYAPSKIPSLRLQQLQWAGELQIPFTTGLLLGIGETESDRWETLTAITNIHQKWGHIQEVILQPHSLGGKQIYTQASFANEQMPKIVAKAREILPDGVTIQIPPNLVFNGNCLLECIEAGARDLGGIGPKDEVNPDYPHPNYQSLAAILNDAGWELVPRLPVYPQYYYWLPSHLQEKIHSVYLNVS